MKKCKFNKPTSTKIPNLTSLDDLVKDIYLGFGTNRQPFTCCSYVARKDEQCTMAMISSKVAWQTIDDTVYIYTIPNDKSYALQNTSKDIWISIASGLGFESIVSELQGKYVVDKVTVEYDVREFIDSMSAEGLLTYG